MKTHRMTTPVTGALAALALATCLWAPSAAVAADTPDEIGPTVGSEAPDFELYDTHGQTHTLTEHREERPVVMVFFRGAW